MSKKFNDEIAKKAKILIGEHFKDRRLELGWSLEQLHEISGVNIEALIAIENGNGYFMDEYIAVMGSMRGQLEIGWADINSMPHFGTPDLN